MAGLGQAIEISRFGGWRGYLAARAGQASSVLWYGRGRAIPRHASTRSAVLRRARLAVKVILLSDE